VDLYASATTAAEIHHISAILNVYDARAPGILVD
jgi:hypothetical protein